MFWTQRNLVSIFFNELSKFLPPPWGFSKETAKQVVHVLIPGARWFVYTTHISMSRKTKRDGSTSKDQCELDLPRYVFSNFQKIIKIMYRFRLHISLDFQNKGNINCSSISFKTRKIHTLKVNFCLQKLIKAIYLTNGTNLTHLTGFLTRNQIFKALKVFLGGYIVNI